VIPVSVNCKVGKSTKLSSKDTKTASTHPWDSDSILHHPKFRLYNHALIFYSMNVRDPFNLRRSPALTILRGTATLAAANLTQKVLQTGTEALESAKQAVEDMSTFSIPKNVPSFTNPQRELENRVWGSSGVTARSANTHHAAGFGGVQDRLGGYFEKNRDLPMYKDKPFSYASSRRRKPLWKSKKLFALLGLVMMAVLYFLGVWGDEATTGKAKEKVKDSWAWLQKPEKAGAKIDWLSRRERVVEAFTLSWDAYDRYAWGMFDLACLATHRLSQLICVSSLVVLTDIVQI
jgi:hypothetical protein